jgi:hypothetical protein
MSVERELSRREALYNYGVIEQNVLKVFHRLLALGEMLSARKNFVVRIGSTAILYGYPKYHGNVQSEFSELRKNMPSYLDYVRQANEDLGISKLVLSGFETERKWQNGNYINPNPISEAQAAKNHYKTEYRIGDFLQVDVHDLESRGGESKFVKQLHNSLIELRKLGETKIIVHVRIQDTIRVRLVLNTLYTPNNESLIPANNK